MMAHRAPEEPMPADIQEIADRRLLVAEPDGPCLARDPHLSDLIGEAFSANAQIVALPLARLGPDFLDLKTGVAGHILQKLVNYRFRIVILGDTTAAAQESDPLRDFIRESNRGETVWFVEDVEALGAKLAAPG
jgi:hypothetical protein